MDQAILYLENISHALTWPVVLLILSLFFKNQFRGLIDVFKSRLNTAESIELGKEGLKIKQKLEKLENTLTGALNSGPLAIIPKENAKSIFKSEELEALNAKNDDPLKYSFEGSLINKNRKISAVVEEIENTELYHISIKVSSIDHYQFPLNGKVKFYLHPTFPNPEPELLVKNGEALLNLVSYGSFTVGAITEDGSHLKLDLAEDVQGVSEHFKNT
ncbi:MAG: pYEATS domain-containing protein [Saprospiraceae bacterium]